MALTRPQPQTGIRAHTVAVLHRVAGHREPAIGVILGLAGTAGKAWLVGNGT